MLKMASDQGPFYKQLGKNIREARNRARAKVSQERLGEMVGLSRTSITNIEKGRQPIMVDVLVRMASALGIELSDLLPPMKLLREPHFPRDVQRLAKDKQRWVKKIISAQPPADQERM